MREREAGEQQRGERADVTIEWSHA